MYRLSCFALVALGALHLLVLGLDAAPYAPGWFQGYLWTFEHWSGIADQRLPLLFSGLAFWSTVGSMGPALIILGYALLWIDDQDLSPPKALIIGLLGWIFLATLLMPLSGLPAVLLASLGLLAGRGLRPKEPA